ncbi:MAG TPA: hypothetical protein VF599_16815 [Pyrinomonadaceae bacterium]|jgi:hypothetical protein
MNKIVIIVLVLIVAVFVIVVLRGSLTDDQPKRGNKTDAANFTREKKAPGWSKTIKKAFGGFGKKLKLDCPPGAPPPPEADFECQSLPRDKDINIPAENGVSFRVVTFVRIKGKAAIEYDDNTEKADDFDLDEQDFPLPNPDTEDPDIGSIVILEKGGRLRISCRENTTCQVAQQ